MRIITILIVGLLACNQPLKQPQDSTGKDSSAKSSLHDDSTKSEVVADSNTVTGSFDSTIYAQTISYRALELLKQLLPQWHLINPDKWEHLWFAQYHKDSSLVNYTSADFNCDGKQDYALLLANSKEEIVAWVLQSNEAGYEAIRLHEAGRIEMPVDVGIGVVPEGKLDYIDLDEESIKSIELKCPAIQVLYFERASAAYYWSKDRYESVQTGD